MGQIDLLILYSTRNHLNVVNSSISSIEIP